MVIEAWEADNTNPNPFEVKFDGTLFYVIYMFIGCLSPVPSALTTEAVRLAMNATEAIDVQRGNIVMIHEAVSPCVLMMTGMDLEEQQYVSTPCYDV